jgi:hypothetical protein
LPAPRWSQWTTLRSLNSHWRDDPAQTADYLGCFSPTRRFWRAIGLSRFAITWQGRATPHRRDMPLEALLIDEHPTRPCA